MTLIEPPRPTPAEVETELTEHVRLLAGDTAQPRPEQIAAVTAVAAERRRTLLVAATGFGKSAVYFSMTRMLRDRGWGPTLVISPLLALMRDQVSAAQRLGLEARTINSTNADLWEEIETDLAADEIDLLLISPERLANPGFRERVTNTLLARPTPLVTDEAHCISDWGHDFRPDYRRLRGLIETLPPWIPVLATTATANGRVTADVAEQLGEDTFVLRTSLDRPSLHCSVVNLATDAERLAWLSELLDATEEIGIIYCLTQAQAEQTASWLRSEGHDVEAYSGSTEPATRIELEDRLTAGSIRALAATSALGMGFDTGHLGLCVHLGLPSSPIAYYQQIGRAGRALERADVIAVPRPDQDPAIWDWFERVSFPPEETCLQLLDALGEGTMSVAKLETEVNLGRQRLTNLLNILDVEGAIERVSGGWRTSGADWTYDHERVGRLTELRRREADAMSGFAELGMCRLRYLREELDDFDTSDCGRCDVCTGNPVRPDPDPARVAAAGRHLSGGDIPIEPRRQWPSGLGTPKGRIAPDSQLSDGRCLARLADGGWDSTITRLLSPEPGRSDTGTDGVAFTGETRSEGGPTSQSGPTSQNGRTSQNGAKNPTGRILDALVELIERWGPEPAPGWMCVLPSRRHDPGLATLGELLAEQLELPACRPFSSDPSRGLQADASNSAHQVGNLWDRFTLDTSALPELPLRSGPVLVLDDEVGSRWTMTVAAHLLTGAGSGPVMGLALRSV